MSISTSWFMIQRIQDVLAEFQQIISERYPEATFAVEVGGEPDGVYLMTTVDLEDTEEVLDVIMDRMLEVQIDEGLPVYVIPIRPTGSKYVPIDGNRTISSVKVGAT
ncbi:MAG: hypothetical protein ACRDJC_12875 [Thermomicrobiales bacterium]